MHVPVPSSPPNCSEHTAYRSECVVFCSLGVSNATREKVCVSKPTCPKHTYAYRVYMLQGRTTSPIHPSPQRSSDPLGRRVNGDGVLIQQSFPLQRQHASQQSEATNDPISITPAAGRATWCDPATCRLCRHRYALGMLALTHRLYLASRCLHTI